jgi:hypothetical protein
VNHDVLFREGTHNRNVTFTPRMLLVDLKGTLKYMPEEGNLYTNNHQIELNNQQHSIVDQVRANLNWDEDKIEVIESEKVQVPEFQKDLQQSGSAEDKNYNLKDTIENWPDFMYTRYHPKSMNIVKNYEHHDDFSSLDTFTAGAQLFASSDFEDEFCDNIRSYMEECNHCQGFQTLFDAVDGFSGLTIKCLEYLEDEYSKAIVAFPLFPPKVKNFQFADEAMSDSIRIINTAYSYAKLSEHSSLFVPLSTMGRAWRTLDEPREFPFVSYESANQYHSSAILATFMDSMSLRYRLKDLNHSSFLSGFCSDLNGYNRKMCGAKIAMPFPMNEKEDLIDFLDRFDGDLMQTISPGTKIGTDRIVQSVTLRGIPKNRLKRPLESAKNQMKMAAYKCSSTSEMMQLYYQCGLYASMSHVTAIESRMRINSPFPKEFFDSRIAKNGFAKEFQSADLADVKELPVMTAVQTSNDLSNTLENLHTNVSRIKIAKIPRFNDTGLEVEEYNEILEQLITFKEQYDENFFL